ncbi:MAG: undecaprenyl-diphosphate phosphatase, partial [Anaerovoracaceae bacterium]
MSYLESIVLGLVQGLAEFLPISSSGHLALLQQWFGIEEDKVLLFAVLLHVGTLISVLIVYWKDVWELIVELGLTIKDIFTGKGLRLNERPVRKLGVMIIVATIPTGLIGVLFNDFFNAAIIAFCIGLL